MQITSESLAAFFRVIIPLLNERQRRLVAAAAVMMLGPGGQARVAEATGFSRNTLIGGAKELDGGAGPSDRVRRPGGGRKKAVDINPDLLAALDSLVEPESRGDPMSPLRWTLKSTRRLAAELTRMGHQASSFLVGQLLHYMDYSLQATSKQNEGAQHADRDAQFHHINAQAKAHIAAGQHVISVDCKKKELVGDYANGGKEWQPAGRPTRVGVHDFPDPEMGKAIPYGVYDVFADEGWVSVGDHHDTAAFAVATIRRWWERMGRARYPDATRLLITADAGGSNAARSRLWKLELARLAADIGLTISVCHFPPGTSKWNRNRAPAVQLHLHELAGTAPHLLPDRRRADCRHHDSQRPERAGRVRRGLLPDRGDGERQGTGRHLAPPQCLARRLELQFGRNAAHVITSRPLIPTSG